MFPLPLVNLALRKSHDPPSLLLIIKKLALVSSPVSPLEDPGPFHLPQDPSTSVLFFIAPHKDSLPIEQAIGDLTLILAPVRPLKDPSAVLLAVHKLPRIDQPFWTSLDSLSVLDLILPFSSVVNPILAHKLAPPDYLALRELSLIYPETRTDESSQSMRESLQEQPVVLGPIRSNLHASPVLPQF